MQREFKAQLDNHTWSLVDLPPGRRAIGCRWVYTMKPSTSTFPHKARLVAQGFSQIHGIDYNETFSPVIRYDSLRLLLALAASHSLSVYQMDVTTAFLNGNLVEELYMRQPPGFIST
ncbi:hypothetical protein KL920_005444, partial [Ogataea angusta]